MTSPSILLFIVMKKLIKANFYLSPVSVKKSSQMSQ